MLRNKFTNLICNTSSLQTQIKQSCRHEHPILGKPRYGPRGVLNGQVEYYFHHRWMLESHSLGRRKQHLGAGVNSLYTISEIGNQKRGLRTKPRQGRIRIADERRNWQTSQLALQEGAGKDRWHEVGLVILLTCLSFWLQAGGRKRHREGDTTELGEALEEAGPLPIKSSDNDQPEDGRIFEDLLQDWSDFEKRSQG
ncbi:hypothetical protein EV356DRAFT_548166 [Viridothelium virens]|uniref:Uncharacterized protein n=1 Tax=Viridothelium virens TaxID=1048519 RepID=A0A6A6H5L9_VIRVR|nr:hypothetical protein EV356DRAFT_548166 [Viridothelium virens]